MKRHLVNIIMALTLLGCSIEPQHKTPPKNTSVEQRYVQAYRYAYMALQENNWPVYKKLMRSVVDLSTAADAPPEQRAVFWYEYARALGVACEWADAEFAFKVARHLDDKTGGPVHQSLNELGRMHVANQHYEKAVVSFTEAEQAFKQLSAQHTDTHQNSAQYQPIRAQVLEDFAYALEQVGERTGDVKKLRDAAAINTGAAADHPDITPYGLACRSR